MAMQKQKPEAEGQDPKFPAADLIAAAELFGVSREMMAGALHGKEEATKAEAEALVEKFKKKGVK